MTHFDFLVIGAGIAGLSAADSLARHGRVALVEQEAHPCHHASGRSAAIFVRSYGSAEVRTLSAMSEAIFERESDTIAALAPPRGIVIVAPAGAPPPGEADIGQVLLTPTEIARLVPVLRPGAIDHGWLEPSAQDIDVHAMQIGYLRNLRAAGGTLLTNAQVTAAAFRSDRWHVTAGGRSLSAAHVVNAAGAWADPVAASFGAAARGVIPMRRSAALIDPPAGMTVDRWPMVVDVGETVYFKPEAGKLMLSPADRTPVDPHDCWAEDIDIAIAVDRYEALTGQQVRRVSHRWAGLRSFAPDDNPVIGADPDLPGFHWLAALGGFGVQTAPATGAIVAAAITGAAMPPGCSPALLSAVSPARLAPAPAPHRPA